MQAFILFKTTRSSNMGLKGSLTL